MRTSVVLCVVTLTLAACASSSLERQAGSNAKKDCMAQANEYVRSNITTIPNEWRQHETYKQYQKCLVEKQNQ